MGGYTSRQYTIPICPIPASEIYRGPWSLILESPDRRIRSTSDKEMTVRLNYFEPNCDKQKLVANPEQGDRKSEVVRGQGDICLDLLFHRRPFRPCEME